MIDLYTWTTPNGRKVSILLEELGLDYTVHPIDISAGDQHTEAFLALNLNNKIPVIVDHENDLVLAETGAILLYLAQKHGRFWPEDEKEQWQAMQWLMWQMGGLGPMLGQAHHFLHGNKGVSDYAEERYGGEAKRLYGVLNKQLEGQDYIVGDYSIVDMACWPWVSRFEWQQIDLNDFPNVRDWYLRIAARPAVQRGYDVPKVTTPIPMPA